MRLFTRFYLSVLALCSITSNATAQELELVPPYVKVECSSLPPANLAPALKKHFTWQLQNQGFTNVKLRVKVKSRPPLLQTGTAIVPTSELFAGLQIAPDKNLNCITAPCIGLGITYPEASMKFPECQPIYTFEVSYSMLAPIEPGTDPKATRQLVKGTVTHYQRIQGSNFVVKGNVRGPGDVDMTSSAGDQK